MQTVPRIYPFALALFAILDVSACGQHGGHTSRAAASPSGDSWLVRAAALDHLPPSTMALAVLERASAAFDSYPGSTPHGDASTDELFALVPGRVRAWLGRDIAGRYVDRDRPVGAALLHQPSNTIAVFAGVHQPRALVRELGDRARTLGITLHASRSGQASILSAPDLGVGVIARESLVFVVWSQVASRREAAEVRIAGLESGRSGLAAERGFRAVVTGLSRGYQGAVYLDMSRLFPPWIDPPTRDFLAGFGHIAVVLSFVDSTLKWRLRVLPEPGSQAAELLQRDEGMGLGVLSGLLASESAPAPAGLPPSISDDNPDVPVSPEHQALLAEYKSLEQQIRERERAWSRTVADRTLARSRILGRGVFKLEHTASGFEGGGHMRSDVSRASELFAAYARERRTAALARERLHADVEALRKRARELRTQIVQVRARDVKTWDLQH